MSKIVSPNLKDPQQLEKMLSPVAYDELLMPSLRLVRSSRAARKIAKILLFALALTIVLMAFAPWQQSVTGTGNIVAFAPRERQQTIESPIKGRVIRWGEDLVENAKVVKGQFLVEIQDLDAEYTERLEAQFQNSKKQVLETENQLRFNVQALKHQKQSIVNFKDQVSAYDKVKEQVTAAQDAFIEMVRKKVHAEQQQLAEYQVAIPQLKAQYARTKKLNIQENISLQKYQEVERKLNEANAKVNRAEAYVDAAKAELEGKKSERGAKIEKAQIDIDYAKSNLTKAQSESSKLESTIAKSSREVQKAKKIVLEMETKLARQNNQKVTAPIDGIIVRITPNIGSGIVKEGTPLCTIVPETKERAVQLWLGGNDVPLIKSGRHVRLQFEGWPAVQFSGWPSIAVGTFGGEVVSIDASDNGMGKFRVIIRPDNQDLEWPEDRYLRQGVRANGWVLLDTVPLWFEVWRKLNGFPPVVSKEEPKKKSKPPKLPK
jgi:multidrug resistance efflux pump